VPWDRTVVSAGKVADGNRSVSPGLVDMLAAIYASDGTESDDEIRSQYAGLQSLVLPVVYHATDDWSRREAAASAGLPNSTDRDLGSAVGIAVLPRAVDHVIEHFDLLRYSPRLGETALRPDNPLSPAAQAGAEETVSRIADVAEKSTQWVQDELAKAAPKRCLHRAAEILLSAVEEEVGRRFVPGHCDVVRAILADVMTAHLTIDNDALRDDPALHRIAAVEAGRNAVNACCKAANAQLWHFPSSSAPIPNTATRIAGGVSPYAEDDKSAPDGPVNQPTNVPTGSGFSGTAPDDHKEADPIRWRGNSRAGRDNER
jgi:hypothetical protein